MNVRFPLSTLRVGDKGVVSTENRQTAGLGSDEGRCGQDDGDWRWGRGDGAQHVMYSTTSGVL